MSTMILVFVSALTAVCSADKLDRVLLPPASAKCSEGDAESLQAPNFRIFDQEFKSVPSGGYTNEFQGVIVDAANPSNRASGVTQTGLGGPRYSYGSTNSRVGDAAFKLVSGYDSTDGVASSHIAPGFESFVTSEDGEVAHALRVAPGEISSGSNTLNLNNNIGLDNFSYDYERDSGRTDSKDSIPAVGVNVQEGYAFKTDDGKDLHLPTPSSVPHNILLSLENNAKEEPAGGVVTGSHNEQKYNEGGNHSESSNGNLYNHMQSFLCNNNAASGPVTQNDHSAFSDSSSFTQGSTAYNSQETESEGSQFGTTSGSSTSDKYNQVYTYQGYNGVKPQASKVNPGQYMQGIDSFNFSDSLSFNQKPIKVPAIELSTPLESNEKLFESTFQPQNSDAGISNIHSSFSQENFGNFNSNDFGESQTTTTQKPLYKQEQEKNVSYYYNKPYKPFIIPTKSTGIFNSFSSKPSVTQSTVTNSQQSLLNRRPFIQMQSKPAPSFTQSNNIGSTVTPLEYQGTLYEYNKPSKTLSSPTTERDKLNGNSSSAEVVSKFPLETSQFVNQFSKPISTNILQQMQSSQATFNSQTSGTNFDQVPTLFTNQFGSKPFNNLQSSSNIQQSQIGQSATRSQFDDKSKFNQKTFSNFQNTGSVSRQNKLNLTYGSQFGRQSQTTAGSSFTSNKYNPAVTQFHSNYIDHNTQKPQSDTSFTIPTVSQSQSSKSTNPHLPGFQVATKPITLQQNQFGYLSGQIGQKPSAYNPVTSQPFQNSATTGLTFGKKPPASGSRFSISTVSSQFNKNTHFDRLPTGFNFQQGYYGQSQDHWSSSSQYDKKPFTVAETTLSPFQQNQASLPGFQSLKKTQTSLGTRLTSSRFGQNQSLEYNQFGQKSIQHSKPFDSLHSFGSTTSSHQSQLSPLFELQSGKKTQSNYQQHQFGTKFGLTFSQKPQTASGSRFSIGTASLGVPTYTTHKLLEGIDLQQNKFSIFSNIFKDRTVQNTHYNPKPFGNNNNFTTFKQMPQVTGSSFTIGIASSQNDKNFIGNTQTGFSLQQNQFGSQYSKRPFGSLLNTTGQKTQATVETGYTTMNVQTQTSQFIQKPFVSTQTGKFQHNLFGSQFNQRPKGTVQSTSTVFTTEYPISTSESQFENVTTDPSQTSSFLYTRFDSNRFNLTKKPMFNVQNIGTVFGSQALPTSTNNFSATSKYEQKPQIASVNAFSSTETDSQFGNLQSNISAEYSNVTNGSFQNAQQPQFTQSSQQFNQPLSTNQDSRTSFSVNDQKPFKSTLLNQTASISQTQFNQSFEQTTEPNLNNEQTTDAILQSTSSLEIFKPIESYFHSEVNTQTTTPLPGIFASTSPLDISSKRLKSFEIGTTQSPNYESFIEAAIFRFGKGQVYPGQPVANSFTATTQALPTIVYGTDSTKNLSSTTQSTFNQTNTSPSSTSEPGTQSTQSIVSTTQISNVSTSSFSTQSNLQTEAFFVKPEVTAISLSSVDNKTEKAVIAVEERLGVSKEQFDANRKPPTFDEQTGYHY